MKIINVLKTTTKTKDENEDERRKRRRKTKTASIEKEQKERRKNISKQMCVSSQNIQYEKRRGRHRSGVSPTFPQLAVVRPDRQCSTTNSHFVGKSHKLPKMSYLRRRTNERTNERTKNQRFSDSSD